MKYLKILAASVLMCAFSLTSCDSYFEVELDDQANLDDVFSQSNTVHSYLRHIYSYIPLEEEIVGSAGAWAVARSDEAVVFTHWRRTRTTSGCITTFTGRVIIRVRLRMD